MADNLSVELDLLDRASKAWTDTVDQALYNAADQIEPLKFSRIQFGIFQVPWDQYTQTAAYIQNRLREGGAEATEMGVALHRAAATYRSQDEASEGDLKKLDVDFSI
ncbi:MULTISPECIES: hypothetical protein [unclassified Nocardia]|uniref:hypothetical protein n=1 Tax=unclassified Nocardia TaxID=2637762 RepID=UPI0036993BC3